MTRKLLTFAAIAACLAVAAPVRAAGRDVRDAKVQAAIDRGLEWLATHAVAPGALERPTGGRYPTAMTALAGIALLSEGSTTTQGKYAPNIRRAVDYLVSRSRPNGLIGDPDARRPLHLRPRLLHALSLAGAGRGGRRRAAASN